MKILALHHNINVKISGFSCGYLDNENISFFWSKFIEIGAHMQDLLRTRFVQHYDVVTHI